MGSQSRRPHSGPSSHKAAVCSYRILPDACLSIHPLFGIVTVLTPIPLRDDSTASKRAKHSKEQLCAGYESVCVAFRLFPVAQVRESRLRHGPARGQGGVRALVPDDKEMEREQTGTV